MKLRKFMSKIKIFRSQKLATESFDEWGMRKEDWMKVALDNI